MSLLGYGRLMEAASEYVAEVRPRLSSPARAVDFVRPFFGLCREKEKVVVVALNTVGEPLGGPVPVSVGTLGSVSMHPRDIFMVALRKGASTVVVFHNHPSGDPDPSVEDIAITKRLVLGGKILGIELTDHIVIGERQDIGGGGYVSIKARFPESFEVKESQL